MIANFLPTSSGRGYMESFMDWYLIHRSEQDIAALFENCVEAGGGTVRTFADPHGNVAYGELHRGVD